jgi:CHAT domain-containing protein
MAESLHRELRDARHEQQEIKSRMQLAAPRVAALRYPDAFDLAATQQILDPGTLLLSYALGDQRGHLFAIGPGPGEVRVFPIPMGAAELRDEIRRLHSLLRPGEAVDAVRFRAARLGELLLAAAADPIQRAERLLILPDGPLHTLPFAALVVAGEDGRQRYLVELKPVTVAASATVFAELKKWRREIGEIRLTAFGDPLYDPLSVAAKPAAGRPEPVLRTALELGLRLDPLPATRIEIEGLEALFPESSHVFLGAAATEERAKSLAADSNAIHFACHGVVDARLPLESALVLSLPTDRRRSGENGLLQAWEIFEQMRIDADLVTLSACDTALGQELAGEGMLGLARAFQYAGARSVLASLWGVSDASTAQLMKHFYGAWKRGRTKDEALRDAQLELIRSTENMAQGSFAHPFYWAAFKLIGDWR